MVRHIYLCFLSIFFVSFVATSETDCTAKKTQIMKPLYPSVKISGYVVIQYDVNESGKVLNPISIESKCLLKDRKNGGKSFQDCGVFIYESIAASRYIEYEKPLSSNGESCRLLEQNYKYTFVNNDEDKKYFKN